MSFSASYLLAIVLAILSFPISLSAQSPAKQAKTVGGSITGRVTIKEKAAVGVVVGLRKSDASPFDSYQRGTTDQDGVYRITNVAAGNYEVLPSAPGFVMADLKDSRSKTVLLGENENVENVNFSLVRGGVITGRVTDVDGRPLIQQQVNIYAANSFDQTSPQRPVFPAGGGQTDDRGIYRIYGLTAGRYKVAAGRGDDGFNMTVFGPNRSVYKQVFHPDVTEQAKATVIEVSEGSEATNVDIVLGRALPTYTINGKVIDSERSLPVPNLRFGVQRSIGTRTEIVNFMAQSNTQGDFVVEGLVPGKYSVFIWPSPTNEMRTEPLTFDIIDQDVSGLTVKVWKGATVTGVVTLETEDKAVIAKLADLQVRAFVTSLPAGTGSGLGSSAASPIGPDGSFRLSGLPGGTINFMVGAVNNPFPPKGFAVARIERDGFSGRNFEIKEGEQVAGVRVILSYGNATLRGVVKLENGALPEGARIFVRLAKPGENIPNLRPPQVDVRGYFLMEGIPAGTYELQASVVGAINAPIKPRIAKREVTLQDGLVTEVTISIDMSDSQKP